MLNCKVRQGGGSHTRLLFLALLGFGGVRRQLPCIDPFFKGPEDVWGITVVCKRILFSR